MNADVIRRYRAQRAKGYSALAAYEIAQGTTSDVVVKYPFLEGISGYATSVSGEVGPFTVEVEIVSDYDARLGDDDVTGTFTSTPTEGAVKNTTSGGSNGQGCKYYVPSNYTLTEAFTEYRKAGMSKSVARDAVAARIQQEMYQDANRDFYGVLVSVSVAGRELANGALWGIDSIPDYDATPYLIDTAADLIDEAIEEAKRAIPGELATLADIETALREATT